VTIEWLNIGSERIRLSLTTEKIGFESAIDTWRVEFDRNVDPLKFSAKTSDDPALAFGWRLAQGVGWPIPGDGPMIAVV